MKINTFINGFLKKYKHIQDKSTLVLLAINEWEMAKHEERKNIKNK